MSRTSKLLIATWALIILTGLGFLLWKYWPQIQQYTAKLSPESSKEVSETGLFSTMLAYNINDAVFKEKGLIDKLQGGYFEFRKDPINIEKLKDGLDQLVKERKEMIKKSGFSSDREIAGYFTWNVIEPEKGKFDWALTDIIVKGAKDAGTKLSTVVQPFASWDQKNTQPISGCQALDFAWYDYKAGPPNDWDEYKNFLTLMVERYKDTVVYWEIGNEYDGACGGYQNNPEGYLKLVQISYETIKKIDPGARILNGGALEFSDNSIRNFWTKFFQLGGGNYLDAFNFHYNEGRNGAVNNPSAFLEVLGFYNNLIKNQDLAKPLWLTEFGTYSGTPQMPPGQPPVGLVSKLPTQNQEFQAAWYFRYSILAFANNTERIFIDLIGPDNQNIGGSAIYNIQGQSRLFIKTLQAIAAEMKDFSKVEKITDGQYKFTVGNKSIYALWSGNLPNGISGKIKTTNFKGEEQTLESSKIQFSANQPILLKMEK